MSSQVQRITLPFTSIIGQDEMKKALLLNAINPRIGGVLIRGEKGTAKSTGVRALAELLPEIDMVKGCPFNCNPFNIREVCDLCAEAAARGEGFEVVRRRVRVVDLPLGVTEDRVVGTIDIERAIKEGIKAIEPGILAQVNRSILYIDEINLLDDHVADVLLDAAAMGVNVVEREGISLSHPSRFILIGTMNPEEGEIRPQLLDRFGLQVHVEGIEDIEQRLAIVKAAEAFEADPEGFRASCEADLAALRGRILEAKAILPRVTISDDLIRLIADTCIQMGVRTHRAEITIVRTAKTIAAFQNRTEVTMDDIREAMELALPHRMRRKPFEEPKIDRDQLNNALENAESKKNDQSENSREPREQPASRPEIGEEQDDRQGEPPPPAGGSPPESLYGVGDPIDANRIDRSRRRDTVRRRSISGRRVETLSARNAGTYISSRFPTGNGDIALDATLRAAAPHQRTRDRQGKAIAVHDQDIRERVRIGKVSTACVFVVDASGSMGAMKRMESAKGAVLSLLLDSYQKRDRIGLVAFRGTEASVLLPLCSSVDLALSHLEEMPTGGKTPLSLGLAKGLETLLHERRKNGEVVPMLVIISDGRANVSANGSVRDEIIGIAEEIRTQGIHTIVIDTEDVKRSAVRMHLGYCREIAEHSAGRYYPIRDLSPETLSEIARSERDSLPVF
ncbi:magnesium chelatase [Methanoculleus taiwanensis]|uniref:Magnesium chelatase n=1 Tax=Methanoculleus taiwanensis TaxID=1550565 RepID=A0A498H023_9EURY|nr:magnesium chelatase subunit D family protein [Methanoculleus taiwanensis]RXE56259.1 magnesium chelatase [Methanoculleus taiwanensis]